MLYSFYTMSTKTKLLFFFFAPPRIQILPDWHLDGQLAGTDFFNKTAQLQYFYGQNSKKKKSTCFLPTIQK